MLNEFGILLVKLITHKTHGSQWATKLCTFIRIKFGQTITYMGTYIDQL